MFGGVAHELGLCITRVQTGFPDVEAMRVVGPNKCQTVNYELEYESKNFLLHMHPVDGCDGIVCWINNWPECPLEVIELRKWWRSYERRRIARIARSARNRGSRVIGPKPTTEARRHGEKQRRLAAN